MLVNINGIEAKKIKNLATFTYSQQTDSGLKNFPALILDRYSGVNGLTIWSRLGEEVGVEGGCYSVYIGAFCPISNKVMFLVDVDHDYASVSMSGQVPDLIPGSSRKRRKGSIIIQNDVWIGYGVTILSGVTVHNGAVIAAHATVTKDVPPYAIVAGNPARVIKYRFDPEIIERLQRIQWWYWDEKTIQKRREWFMRSPEEFARRFDISIEKEHISSKQRLDDAQIAEIPRNNLYLTFADLDSPYSVLFKIIRAFAQTHSEDDLLIISAFRTNDIEETAKKIYEFAEGIDADCGLYVRCTERSEVSALISACGTLITSRVQELVRYTCLADSVQTEVVSGVDIPIF